MPCPNDPAARAPLGDAPEQRSLEVRIAGVSAAPLPSSIAPQGSATNSQQGTDPSPPASNSTSANAAPAAPQSTAEIPAADLAPLYNYVQDCRACQLQLTAAKQNATDDAVKIRALTRERDAAITAAKGGPVWLRLKRNAHWLAIGAALGAVTSTAALCHKGHCR
jgi:hypothetical protein